MWATCGAGVRAGGSPVRANERAAAALGINVLSVKLYAFGVAAGISSVGGILYAFRNTSIRFGNYDNFGSIQLVASAVIGGSGYVGGAVLGGTLFPGGFNTRVLPRSATASRPTSR